MNPSGKNRLGQVIKRAMGKSICADATAGRGSKCKCVEIDSVAEGNGTENVWLKPTLQKVRVEEFVEIGRIRMAAFMVGVFFGLIVLGLAAVTTATLLELPTTGITDYFNLVLPSVCSVIAFIGGYALKGHRIKKM